MSGVYRAAQRAQHRAALRHAREATELARVLSDHLNGLVQELTEMYHDAPDTSRLHELHEELLIVVSDADLRSLHPRHHDELSHVADDLALLRNALVFGLARDGRAKEILRRAQYRLSVLGGEQYAVWAGHGHGFSRGR